MLIRKKNARLGRYPSCDMVNNAIRFILDGKYQVAIEELVYAVKYADGYIYEDLKQTLKQSGLYPYKEE